MKDTVRRFYLSKVYRLPLEMFVSDCRKAFEDNDFDAYVDEGGLYLQMLEYFNNETHRVSCHSSILNVDSLDKLSQYYGFTVKEIDSLAAARKMVVIFYK